LRILNFVPDFCLRPKSPTTEVTSSFDHFIVTAVDLAASRSDLKGRRRTYRTILKLADNALCKMVRHVLLRPLKPELNVIACCISNRLIIYTRRMLRYAPRFHEKNQKKKFPPKKNKIYIYMKKKFQFFFKQDWNMSI
jgi:hypothetical protein